MHGAALAGAEAVLAAVDLRHHAVHVAALGDAVAVAAMGAGDAIAIVEVQAHADAACLLAGIEVHETGDFTGRELDVKAFLEFADRAHGPVSRQQFVSAELHTSCSLSLRGGVRF